ncbi:hypothetical protein M9H77_35644 [Catharanthus roseus]|uniref:Uncharacterized protein n=1 Tax=Catharanthus roseus TaxID=4058 RepID=A0ACB9ZPL0_CATRO|nr:hypothetical protein M9H77_35644 [Catharanthus roseus]
MFCKWNKRNINEGPGGWGAGKHIDARGLIERFSKSKHLEELHKYQNGDKKEQYMDFLSEEFWSKFHEAQQRVEEEIAATGIAMPDEVQLMATIVGGLSLSQLYGAGWEEAYLRAKSSRVAAGLPPCCLDAEQRIMRRVEAVVSRVLLPSTST